MSKNKFFELELLRVTAIFLILYDHSTPYLGWDARVSSFMKIPGAVGLGMFFALSGFLIQRSRSIQGSDFNAVSFLKKRLTRIFPLYWIAIVFFIIRFHYFSVSGHSSSFDPLLPTFGAHFLALQLFFIPVTSEIFTLWYIGALVPYYLLFASTTKFKFHKFLSLNLLVLIAFVLLKLVLSRKGIDLIDIRLILHYPTFLLGTVFAYLDPELVWLKTKALPLTLISGLAAISYEPLIGIEQITVGNRMTITVGSIAYYGYSLIWSIFLICLIFQIARPFSRFTKTIQLLSDNSYAIYLFHRPIYATIYVGIITWISSSIVVRTLLFPGVTLILIGICYYLTRFDSQVLNKKITQLADRMF